MRTNERSTVIPEPPGIKSNSSFTFSFTPAGIGCGYRSLHGVRHQRTPGSAQRVRTERPRGR